MKHIYKKLFLFVIVYILLGTLFVSFFWHNKNVETNEALKEQVSQLKITYKQGLDRFETVSKNIDSSLEEDEIFLTLISDSVDANQEQKDINREKLYNHLKKEYEKLKHLEVMQLQIVLPNNESFLRMHAKEQFGDSLKDVRYGIVKANESKTPVFGFEEGKSSHAFRYVYPLYKNGVHIGVIDIAFSSTMLQNYSMRANSIHTHFIVDRNIFKTQEWKTNTQEPYMQSSEHRDFMFSMSDHIDHNRLDKSHRTLIEPNQDIIDKNIAKGVEFAIYRDLGDSVKVVAFVPVRNIKNDKTVAYFVSYVESSSLSTVTKNFNKNISIALISLLIVMIGAWFIVVYNEKLKKELKYDSLTKIFNRKYFITVADEELDRAKRFNSPFSVAMVDIDFFKYINDTYGHQVGDIVLREMALIMHTNTRKYDLVARYGGEEFILLILANGDDTRSVVESLRKKIEEHSFAKDLNLKITASFGLSQLQNIDETLDDIIKRADDALYISKKEGRNRVTIS